MKIALKKIAFIGILTALYVVLSLTLKIPLGLGNIMLDLGYLALTVAAFTVGPWAAFVGGVGALLESLWFSAYGISYGWIVMNILIGLICGLVLPKIKLEKFYHYLICGAIIFGAVLVGITAKTIIECKLYNIPYLVKIPKSAVAFGVDTLVMWLSIPIATQLKTLWERRKINGRV